MTTVLRSSRLRVAAFHLAELTLGAAYPLLFLFAIAPADNLPSWMKMTFAIASLFGIFLVLRSVLKITKILSGPSGWQVTIDETTLRWETPIAQTGFPVQINLADIEQTVRLETWLGRPTDEVTIDTTYEVHTTKGTIITFDQDTAGINPHRVFLALRDRGIPYSIQKLDKTADLENTQRSQEKTY